MARNPADAQSIPFLSTSPVRQPTHDPSQWRWQVGAAGSDFQGDPGFDALRWSEGDTPHPIRQ